MPFIRERLKQRRISMGITLQEVATSIGVEKPTVQRYESGTIKKLDTLTVEKLASATSCSPAYLMGWQEEIQDVFVGNHYSDRENILINNYHSLNEEGQEYFQSQMDYALSQQKYKKHNQLSMDNEKQA